jgi:predicted O-methyltransferase YrrM
MGRLFSETWEFVGVRRLPNALRSGMQAVRRKVLDQHPRLPWIPFSAIRALAAELRSDWVAWEIGSGMSTVWLAERVARLTSIEADERWFASVGEMLKEKQLTNVDLRLEWRGNLMADFSEVADGSLDFLLIDAGPRDLCLSNGFQKVRRGGLIYCDNWDVAQYWQGSRAFLERQAPVEIRRFVDYVPAMVGVSEGALIRV